MTYQNPNRMDNGWNTGVVIAAVVAGVVVIGGLFYAFSGSGNTGSSTASGPATSTSSPSTTGQSDRTSVNPPVPQNSRNPIPPAATPAPPTANP
jgi:hypothetical protein